jgi:hypothetical protein
MSLLEDTLKGNIVILAVTGAAALALPILVPSLAPSLRSALKLGVALFLESQAEAEASIIESLVRQTVQGLLAIATGPGSEQERKQAAQVPVAKFEARARARARRFGKDEADQANRYRRQVASLKRAISTARKRHPKQPHPVLDHASEIITEDW